MRKIMRIKTKGIFTLITQMIEIPKDFTGLIHIFSTHTTCGIKILENETLLKTDYQRFLEKQAPSFGSYSHNIIEYRDVPPEERLNGHSHIRVLFFQTSETIPVKNGKMLLGKWQDIFLVDLDPSREREIIITLCKI